MFSRGTVADASRNRSIGLVIARRSGPNFVPVIIERFARERLWAVAHAEGRVEKPLDEVVRRSAKSLSPRLRAARCRSFPRVQ